MHSFDVEVYLLCAGTTEILPPKGRCYVLPPPGCVTRKMGGCHCRCWAMTDLVRPFSLIPVENASQICSAPTVGMFHSYHSLSLQFSRHFWTLRWLLSSWGFTLLLKLLVTHLSSLLWKESSSWFMLPETICGVPTAWSQRGTLSRRKRDDQHTVLALEKSIPV